VKIGQREIGPSEPPYIIAELGVNHDGSVERAIELTRAAAGAGADAVKLQLFETDRLMSRAAKLAAYQKAAGETDPVAMLRRLELSIEEMSRVVDVAHEHTIDAIVTVFSVELVEKAERLGWDAYKTASPDIVHRPLLEALAGTGKPMIVSTGASTMEEVERAVGWLEPARERLAVLQCVSCYPTPLDRGEWDGIRALRERFELPIGYSDHTDSIGTSALAVRNGACVLEKHMTYDTSAKGPDHAASLTARQLTAYVSGALASYWTGRESWTPRLPIGEGKRVLDIERDVRTVSRQSIVSVRAKRAGEVLKREDVTFKRPGTGVLAYRVDDVVGKRLKRDVEADVPVVEEDVEW
jgi:N,N'-diacetyllegionaminate synthase